MIYRKLQSISLIGLTIFLSLAVQKESKKEEAQALNIPVTNILVEDIPVQKEFVGQVYGVKDIPIRSRVEGYLEGLYFKEGSHVKAGDLLYKVDPQPYQAEVAMRKGQLAEAQATLIGAKSDLRRYEPLAKINAVSQADLDQAVEENGAAESLVDAAKANLRMAQIELGYTQIESPISELLLKKQKQKWESL